MGHGLVRLMLFVSRARLAYDCCLSRVCFLFAFIYFLSLCLFCLLFVFVSFIFGEIVFFIFLLFIFVVFWLGCCAPFGVHICCVFFVFFLPGLGVHHGLGLRFFVCVVTVFLVLFWRN